MYSKTRRYFFELMNPSDGNRLGKLLDTLIILLIAVSIVAVILESDKATQKNYKKIFYYFEIFSTAIFSIEYLVRLWTCVEDERYSKPISGRIRYIFSVMALIDLIAIFLSFIKMDLRFARAIRLFRLFRLFKIGRYSSSINQLLLVFEKKKEELAITFLVAAILLILASSVMYFAENSAQPLKFSSIPASMWWGVATLTTVGYGDVYPITPIGKFCGSIIAFLGVGIAALPAGIIASGFNEAIQEKKEAKMKKLAKKIHYCPHCATSLQIESDELILSDPSPNPSPKTPVTQPNPS